MASSRPGWQRSAAAATARADCLACMAQSEQCAREAIRPETREAFLHIARGWDHLAFCWGELARARPAPVALRPAWEIRDRPSPWFSPVWEMRPSRRARGRRRAGAP